MEIEKYIKVYKFSDQLCDEILEKYEFSSNWTNHSWGKVNENNVIKKFFYNDDFGVLFLDNQKPCNLIKDLIIIMKNYSKTYFNDLNFGESLINSISIPRLNLYRKNQYMRKHVDHIKSLFDGENSGIPIISFVGCLNSDFHGGELIINKTKFSLKKGDLIIFPSNFVFPHEVLPIISGVRYSFVSWGF